MRPKKAATIPSRTLKNLSVSLENGLGGTEEYVGELGAAHGAAPAVAKTGAEGLADQGFRQKRIAGEWGIETEGKDIYDLAHEVAETALME